MSNKKLKFEDMTQQEQEYANITHVDNRSHNDEISLRAIEELLNTKTKLKTISRVKFEQVSIISKLFLYSDVFGDTFTKKLAKLILELQISTSGLGRRELVQLVQQRSFMDDISTSKRSNNKDIFR